MIKLGISDIKQYKIFLAIKKRHQKYGIIGISRCEWVRFGLTERKLRMVIDILESTGLLKFEGKRMTNNGFKCNLYKLSQEFIAFLESVKDFVKKQFEFVQYTSDDVLEYVKTFAKKKSMQYKFEINGTWYIVADRGKWRGKIYDTVNRRIVSLIMIQNIR